MNRSEQILQMLYELDALCGRYSKTEKDVESAIKLVSRYADILIEDAPNILGPIKYHPHLTERIIEMWVRNTNTPLAKLVHTLIFKHEICFGEVHPFGSDEG